MSRDIPYPNRQQLAAAQRNGNRKDVGIGCTQAIRDALEDGPLTFEALCARMPQFRPKQIGPCLRQLMSRLGGVVSNGRNPAKYSLYTPAPARGKKIVPPPYCNHDTPELRRDPFEHMNLALGTRHAPKPQPPR
jgi:hypothetical protein